MENELILFSDESITKGKFYSNFYGGVMVGGSQYLRITHSLKKVLEEHSLTSEIKWSKVTPLWLEGYKALMDKFFHEVLEDNLRVRIMFRQNAHTVPTLDNKQVDNEYFLLFYQFIKHGFHLDTLPDPGHPIQLRLYFDQFPHTKEKAEAFKNYILRLQESKFRQSRLVIAQEDITEVRSHDHILLQCLDVVLGAMAFRLNDQHKERHPGVREIPKRTKAKIALYKHILMLIKKMKPRFNIGESTGMKGVSGNYRGTQDLPYAHWAFKPHQSEYDHSVTKRPQKN